MRLPQNYVLFHWSMFWELTIAFSNPSCPTLKFWFWLTSNFLKTRFFQKAHFKGPWKARSKGLANDESKTLLLISPELLSEKVEVEEKSAQPQLFDQGHLQFYRNLFFWKNWYYASLESAKHVLSEYAIKCYFAGFTRASFRENWMWIKKSAQPQLFAMAHLQFSQNSFFQKTDIMHYWRALSTCLANMQSNVILLVLPGLHSEKIECELKKVPNPNFLQWLTSNFLKTPFFKKLILCITGER